MATNAAEPIDVSDIEFRAHSKYHLFDANASTPRHNFVDLLVSASSYGLVIVGKPSDATIQVLRLNDVIENKESPSAPMRTIGVAGEPYLIAISCDHSMLAVVYTLNGCSFLDIFAVQSLLSTNVKCIASKILVANDPNVRVKQLLWNPVIPNTMAICLSDGGLGAYVFKETSFEYNSLDKSEMAQCASWSPKGKQIVVAFPNGKLAQYKPDLKLAKTIPCTVALFEVQFLPIAIQWLSTYQFAVVFMERREEQTLHLFIINAQKNVPPAYINFGDICYSQNGPRAPQVFLMHILPWNLLLMASANAAEIGVLGTNESGETPAWRQYLQADSARAELPLTADYQETFPIGLALETGSTHQLTIGEVTYPVMPMIHILSTHGFLLSFDLLNKLPTRVDICSPPQNIGDQSGIHLFQRPNVVSNAPALDSSPPREAQPPPQSVLKTPNSNDFQSNNNLTFAIPETGATSTPARPPANSLQSKPAFGLLGNNAQQPKPLLSNMFAAQTTPSGIGLTNKELPKPILNQMTAPSPVVHSTPKTETNQPFLTVPPNYKPASQAAKTSSSTLKSNSENDAILLKMVSEEIDLFDNEIRASLDRSKNVQINICDKTEFGKLMKSIDEMQEITSQATESTESLNSDVQSLRLTLYELFAMQAELQSKVEALDSSSSSKASEESLIVKQNHKRQLNKLQNLLAQNQARFEIFSKQIDANWSAHLEKMKENDKARMRIPTLENVYLTLEKIHQILLKEKEKIQKIKARIGVKDSTPAQIKYSYSNTENLKGKSLNDSMLSSPAVNKLIDSVLSMTIGNQIKNEQKPLDPQKIETLRNFLAKRHVTVIKPSRPDRKGLNSEVIIEKKLEIKRAEAKAQKEKENLAKLQMERPKPAKAEPTIEKATLKPAVEKPKQPEQIKKITEPQVKQKESPKPQINLTQTKVSQPSAITTNQISMAKSAVAQPIVSNAFSILPKPSFGSPIPDASQVPKSTLGLKTSTPPVANADQPKPSISFGSPSIGTGIPFGKPVATANVAPTQKIDGKSGFTLNTSTSANSIFSPTINTPKPSTEKPFANVLSTITAPSSKPEQKGGIFSGMSLSASKESTTPGIASSGSIFTPLTKSDSKLSSLLTQTTNQQSSIVSTADSGGVKFGGFDSITTTPVKSDKENAPVIANVLSGSAAATATGSPFSFSFNNAIPSSEPLKLTTKPTQPTNEKAQLPQSTASPAVTIAKPISTPATSTTAFSFGGNAGIFGTISTQGGTSTTVTTTVATSTVSSTSDVGSIFKDVSICKPNVADNSNAGKSLFSTSSFGAVSSAATTPSLFSNVASPTSIFGGKSTAPVITTSATTTTAATTPAVPSSNMFGSKPAEAPGSQPTSIFGGKSAENTLSFSDFSLSGAAAPTATSESGGLFGSVAAKPAQNIFGGVSSAPSVFGNSTTPTSGTNNIFGGAVPNNTANIFGGAAATTNNAQQNTSIFGGAGTNSTNAGNLFSKPFGQQPATGGSVFGGATSPSSGGSLFSGTSTFGSPASSQQQQQQQNSVFGSPSPFGGSFAQAASNAPTFGSPPTFGSQNASFGLAAAAANQPTFGSQPSFGGAATFGSPKTGFGTFANIAQNPSFGSPTETKNSLFESLGSSENAMTFGNLAQNQASPPQPKPQSAFGGGSSFSSWR